MRILVIGSGGRENAIVWKLSRDATVDKIFSAPGNAGMTGAETVSISATDLKGLLEFAKANAIDLTVVGPETPLVDGIVDLFEEMGVLAFGPGADAARLEGSKSFAKEFMARRGVPTAKYAIFTNAQEAKDYIVREGAPIVVKASGLAAGKGAIVCINEEDALSAVESIMIERAFGEAGDSVVIEEMLSGEEASILAVSDGRDYVLLPSSQDHKRVFDDDKGMNTGGMGAYSPAPVITEEMTSRIRSEIIEPTLTGMAEEGSPFKGVLYAGLMITDEGPKVIEYNVRFGDPEAQAVIPLLPDNFAELLLRSAKGDLHGFEEPKADSSAVCVVMAAAGYPSGYNKGMLIEGLDSVTGDDVFVFHAGTAREGDKIISTGGRILGVTALAGDLKSAVDKAYSAVGIIHFEESHYRKDIGQKGLKRLGEV